MNDVNIIAKWFINEIHPEPLKLQKLLYLAQGFSLALNDKLLFEADLEAWVHGPVVPEVYFKYKEYKFNPISLSYEIPELDEETLEVLIYVKENYGKYDSKFLEEMTHNQEPWINAREGLDPDERSEKIISKEIITEYFINLLHQPFMEEWDS